MVRHLVHNPKDFHNLNQYGHDDYNSKYNEDGNVCWPNYDYCSNNNNNNDDINNNNNNRYGYKKFVLI